MIERLQTTDLKLQRLNMSAQKPKNTTGTSRGNKKAQNANKASTSHKKLLSATLLSTGSQPVFDVADYLLSVPVLHGNVSTTTVCSNNGDAQTANYRDQSDKRQAWNETGNPQNMTTLKIQQSQKQRDSNVIQRYGNKDSKITTTDKRTTKEQRQEKQQHQRLKQQQTLEIKTDIKEILNTENYNKEKYQLTGTKT